VGAFLMPSTWLLLVALTAGRAALDTFTNNGTPGADSLGAGANPFEGLPDAGVGPGQVATPDATPGLPGWLVALLVVAAVVAILAALFFGWVGHTLAQRQRSRTADAMA
jgi:hypothetical protein